MRRSESSINSHGTNTNVYIKPDQSTVVVRTSSSYLILYHLQSTDSPIYKLDIKKYNLSAKQGASVDLAQYQRSTSNGHTLRYIMAIKIDGGIYGATVTEEGLVVSNVSLAALQFVPWQDAAHGTQTYVTSKFDWMEQNIDATISDVTYDRLTNLYLFITTGGQAYAAQRGENGWRGWCFFSESGEKAIRTTVNARFSLLSVGCESGTVFTYTVRDYHGHIIFSHRVERPPSFYLRTPSLEATEFGKKSVAKAIGKVTAFALSPDGYACFVGYDDGWALWSVYGRLLSSSFLAEDPGRGADDGLTGVESACWNSSGLSILILFKGQRALHSLELARTAVPGCFSPDNVSKPLLQTSSDLLLYRGSEHSALGIINPEALLYNHIPYPKDYSRSNEPIRCCVVSSDGKHVAIAGNRGFAYCSLTSGSWRSVYGESAFETGSAPDDDAGVIVRGGMCWYGHVLAVALEDEGSFELRLYSKDAAPLYPVVTHTEHFASPILLMSRIDDSLLVYTADNILHHFMFTAADEAGLLQIGQISLGGIVHAPTRVRSISWFLPPSHIREGGDPSQDVSVATVLLLVDGKLVMLKPDSSLGQEVKELKYSMSVLAERVEIFSILPSSMLTNNHASASLWVYAGTQLELWPDLNLLTKPMVPIRMPLDMYPLSIIVSKGIVTGIQSEIARRRNVNFCQYRFVPAAQLFLNRLLRWMLESDMLEEAVDLARSYRDVAYFSHILEVLLHEVLDEEVDEIATQPKQPQHTPLLPAIIQFLTRFPKEMLDVVVGCTRKTEMRSWGYLFQHVGSTPKVLFDRCMAFGMLKTAGGYLLVLHTLEQLDDDHKDTVTLLQRALEAKDWDLCKELARFLSSMDSKGLRSLATD